MTQRIIPILSPNFLADTILESSPDWSEIFGNHNPLALEIGCGIGHFIVQLAQQQPEVNFLAIDIYNKGCLKTCARIDAAGLNNVRVMRVEARWLMDKGLSAETLSAVYINCPDPWPKKRHRNRRLVNREFMLALAHYLIPGGDFYFSSDFDDYAEDVAGQIYNLKGYENVLSRSWTHSLPGYPSSKYMQRFLDIGQQIYYIHYRRDASVPCSELPPASVQRGYRVDWQRVGND